MTTKLDFRHTLLAVGATLLFAACSGGATPGAVSTPAGAAPTTAAASGAAPTHAAAASADAGGTAPTEAACALVTEDEVGTAAGFSIATVSGGGGTCFFQNADPSQYVSVQLFTNQAGMATWLGLESSGLHVSGLGDDAFWMGTTGMMFVRKGDRAFLLLNPAWVMTPDTDTAHLDSMTTLARAALLNL
ncbi:MAG TPA: hypothetical protein VF323_08005 [Candidatus Limnocylindrales bacterium]